MRVVLDTNVLVSGILSVLGPPARIVEALLSGHVEPAFDPQIRAEYDDVLGREELGLNPDRLRAVLDVLDRYGVEVSAAPWAYSLPDPDDAPFLAVAAALGCPVVTGNLRHFPARTRGGVAVLSPREFVEFMAARGSSPTGSP